MRTIRMEWAHKTMTDPIIQRAASVAFHDTARQSPVELEEGVETACEDNPLRLER